MKIRTASKLLIPILILALSLSSCKQMTPTTPDTFKTTMESLGYTVTDATDEYEDEANIDIEAIYVASKGALQFGFVVCSSSDEALDMYASSLENFEDKQTSVNVSTSLNFGNHSKCTLDNGEEYMVFSRIDDTCVVVTADNANKSEIKDVLKELGY